MKESRIIAFIGITWCTTMATLHDGKSLGYFWLALAAFWFIKYVYLSVTKNK